MKLRRLPAQSKRVETGPIQFGDDWPGVFIRGDNAIFLASMIDRAIKEWLERNPSAPPLQYSAMQGHVDLLFSCMIDERPDDSARGE